MEMHKIRSRAALVPPAASIRTRKNRFVQKLPLLAVGALAMVALCGCSKKPAEIGVGEARVQVLPAEVIRQGGDYDVVAKIEPVSTETPAYQFGTIMMGSRIPLLHAFTGAVSGFYVQIVEIGNQGVTVRFESQHLPFGGLFTDHFIIYGEKMKFGFVVQRTDSERDFDYELVVKPGRFNPARAEIAITSI